MTPVDCVDQAREELKRAIQRYALAVSPRPENRQEPEAFPIHRLGSRAWRAELEVDSEIDRLVAVVEGRCEVAS